jgi:hypothetical protein
MAIEKDELLKSTMQFLKGARVPTIALRLNAFGFNDTSWKEGWTLMQDVVDSEFTPPTPIQDINLLNQLDDWENLWFPIIQIVLTRHNAPLAAQIFEGLTQTEGMELIPSLTTLHARLDALLKKQDKESEAAAALLIQRGVNAAQLDTLADMLKRATTFTDAATIQSAANAEETLKKVRARHEAALGALRAYLREWTLIARAAVKNGNYLRQLGLGTIGRPRRTPNNEDHETERRD